MTHFHTLNEGAPPGPREQAILAALGGRSIALVGMMGCGKTSAGKRLAQQLGLRFVDADAEIEAAHKLTVSEIFSRYGEAYFREGETRVIARLLSEGPLVLATGGGAYVNEKTRAVIEEKALSVWIDAEFDVLMRRVRRRPTRPLLQNPDPEGTMRALLDARLPIYRRARLRAQSKDNHIEMTVADIIDALGGHLAAPSPAATPAPAPAAPARVHVELGARAYDILIGGGLIADAGARIAALAPGAACCVVADANVAALYLDPLRRSLEGAGLRCASVVVPPGEATKSYEQFARVCDGVLAARIERGDFVVALGGGVVGDLAGFVAASVRRGVRFIQVPTSLLAQVDSSVGGKTGINSPLGKNLVGAFHQPALVLADADALGTLDPREFRAGYAEVVKYGLIDDFAFFEWLEANWRAIFAGGPERSQAIARSCAAKAAVVARDETEQGDRALLNLGHTFGHALERLTHYDGARLIHGEGVAIGMAQALRFSVRKGLCAAQESGRAIAHLAAAGLPTRVRDIPGWSAGPEEILDAMLQDKKVQRGALTFILARGIGQSFIAKGVPADEVLAFLTDDLTG